MKHIFSDLLVFIISILLILVIRYLSIRKALFDIPNERSSHSKPIPRTGGIAIMILWYLYLAYDMLFIQSVDNLLLKALFFCLPITIISIIDDFIDVKPFIRFIVQFFSISLLIIVFHFWGQFGIVFSWPIIMGLIFIGVWFVNLYNFMDGIDGYAVSQAVVFLVFTSLNTRQWYIITLAMILFGFFVLNWHPAKIFMGDSGSTLLGFSIFTLAVFFHLKGSQHFLLSLSFTSIFWFDASITLFRRLMKGEQITKPHKKHAYQRLTQSGLSHSMVSLLLIIIYFLIGTLYFLLLELEVIAILVLIVSIIANLLLYLWAEKRLRFT